MPNQNDDVMWSNPDRTIDVPASSIFVALSGIEGFDGYKLDTDGKGELVIHTGLYRVNQESGELVRT